MILYFTNRMLSVLGFASTNIHSKYVIIEDEKVEDASTGTNTLEFKVVFDDENRLALETMIRVGNCVLRNESGESLEGFASDSDDFYTIVQTEIDAQEKTIYAYAEDAGLDLIHDLAPAVEYKQAVAIASYINDAIAGSGFKIRENEIEEKQLKLSWSSETTVKERLQDIAENFDCNLAFRFEVQGLAVVGKYIDILESGGNETDVILYMDRDVSNITISKSIESLATALHPTGRDGLTLSGYSYDDGDFYTNGEHLHSREAFENWQRDLPDAAGDVYKTFSCEASTKLELCNAAIEELKKLREPTVQYEVEIRKFSAPVSIRDRISVVDDKGELYLSAKALELKTSVSQGSKTATLGDYIVKSSGISDKVQALSDRFTELSKNRYTWIAYADDEKGTGISLEIDGKAYTGFAYNADSPEVDISDPSRFKWVRTLGNQGEKGEDAVLLKINSSRGTVFKNNAVSTILTVTIFYGSQKIENVDDLRNAFGIGAHIIWKWQRMGEEEFKTILSTDSRIKNDGFAFVLSPEDVDVKVTFNCELEV